MERRELFKYELQNHSNNHEHNLIPRPCFTGDWYILAVLKFVPGARRELQLEFASSHVSHSTSVSQAQI